MASSSTCSTRMEGGLGSTTRVTTKCFSRLRGVTAVHFVINSFLGLSGFFCARCLGTLSTATGLGSGFMDVDDAARFDPPAAARQKEDTHPADLRLGERLLDAGYREYLSRTWRAATAADLPLRSELRSLHCRVTKIDCFAGRAQMRAAERMTGNSRRWNCRPQTVPIGSQGL